ncbi:HAD-IIB family hydrolase [Natronospirillum operosum]|uniref:HAD-IIB family hydrolase n=1 Tax=Natronospirillum operosum TaxID=2759953 RepID=A0A4Z0W7Z1_9GAMM|nr:HAD-IIB family hydrolase [Natronospirillum operosum]TGG93517.1 HAD-IIB family hydrolase [Natronospirillum operosum]
MNEIDFRHTDILFTDVDDTLTTNGQLLPETYLALCRLAAAGVRVIPVTGGCAGWCDQIIRTWPVRAVIGEGGGFCIERIEPQITQWRYWQDAETHRADQARILAAVDRLQVGFRPALATDQPFRLVDVAVDYNQQQRLSDAQVATLQQALSEQGFNVRRSSIHLNVWLGDFDKRAMALRVGEQLLGLQPEELKERAVFVGDAPNDESMFSFFPNSVGVANIRRHLDAMMHQPTVITRQRCGLGFAELAAAWLSRLPTADTQPAGAV